MNAFGRGVSDINPKVDVAGEAHDLEGRVIGGADAAGKFQSVLEVEALGQDAGDEEGDRFGRVHGRTEFQGLVKVPVHVG